ncbi:MAG: penicillin-binding transpeptidase domain-containing protein, partial [Bacilli bacterium]
KIGTKKLVPFAKQLGFKSKLNAYPSLALGTSEVTPLEMNNAYAHFANGGKSVTPYYIEKVTDKDGHVLYEAKKEKKQLLNANNVFIMNHLLQGMFNNKLGGYTKVTGYTLAGQLSQHYAGKSGSTNSDSWMIGYTPAYVSTVWIGFDDNAPLRTIEQQTVSKKIWATLNEKLHRNYGDLYWPEPDDVIAVEIGVLSGGQSNGACAEQTTTEYYRKNNVPATVCFQEGKNQKQQVEQNVRWQLF